jgi:hypothetical protein
MIQSLPSESQKKRTMSWQLPFGAPPHLSLVICMRPCSPAPPTADGLQPLSCIAKDASKIGGTVCRDQQSEAHATHRRGHQLLLLAPYFSNVAIMLSLHGENAVFLALSKDTVISCSISTRAGVQPSPVMPQLIQSIWPLGPLSFVIFANNNGGQIYPMTNEC